MVLTGSNGHSGGSWAVGGVASHSNTNVGGRVVVDRVGTNETWTSEEWSTIDSWRNWSTSGGAGRTNKARTSKEWSTVHGWWNWSRRSGVGTGSQGKSSQRVLHSECKIGIIYA